MGRKYYLDPNTGEKIYIRDKVPRAMGDKTEDLFNIVSFDTFNKIIKVMRVGAEYDVHMRHRGTMSIDYKNRKLLSSN